MVIYVKNPELKKRVFRSMRRYERLAINSYKKGDMRKGKFYEKKSDDLYAKNYKKIFGVKKR